MRNTVKGEIGWVGLALYVWAWDTFAPESLSRAFGRALERPARRSLVIGATAYILSHLFFKKPAKLLIKY